jgi:hypothetical protein
VTYYLTYESLLSDGSLTFPEDDLKTWTPMPLYLIDAKDVDDQGEVTPMNEVLYPAQIAATDFFDGSWHSMVNLWSYGPMAKSAKT